MLFRSHVIETVFFFSTQIINLLFILSVNTAQISLKPAETTDDKRPPEKPDIGAIRFRL